MKLFESKLLEYSSIGASIVSRTEFLTKQYWDSFIEQNRMALRHVQAHDINDPNLKAIHSLYFDRVVSMDCQIFNALGQKVGISEMKN